MVRVCDMLGTPLISLPKDKVFFHWHAGPTSDCSVIDGLKITVKNQDGADHYCVLYSDTKPKE